MSLHLYKRFTSPYHTVPVKSRRYQRALRYVIVLLVLLPLLFIPFKSFVVYLIAHAISFVLFPTYIWIYLKGDQITDLKLDIIKVFVIISLYGSYLLVLAWLMLYIFKPHFSFEYTLLTFGYVLALIIVSSVVAGTHLYSRYGGKHIKQTLIREDIYTRR